MDPEKLSRAQILNPVEEAILTTLSSGCSVEEAAEQLGIELGAVRTHLAKAARHLGARTRAEALLLFAAGLGGTR